jgi:prevent-host-death family protein
MEKVIQATAANRSLSRILREVAQGDSYTVTSHGRPIARIVPANGKATEAAKQRLLERLRSQPAMNIGPRTRDELYDCQPRSTPTSWSMPSASGKPESRNKRRA